RRSLEKKFVVVGQIACERNWKARFPTQHIGGALRQQLPPQLAIDIRVTHLPSTPSLPWKRFFMPVALHQIRTTLGTSNATQPLRSHLTERPNQRPDIQL